MHFLLIYDLASDYLERRAALRDDHLRMAWQSSSAGHLVLGGALQDPVDQAILLFSADSPDVVGAFARADPYVRQGLVTAWRIRPWMTVAGPQATNPVHPSEGAPPG